MPAMPARLLRQRARDEPPRVTNMELFFDLVYVFAITQLSDFLFHELSARTALEGLIMFLGVWWARRAGGRRMTEWPPRPKGRTFRKC
jgi:low temperature requirement protein LtrA